MCAWVLRRYDLPADYNARILQYTRASTNDWCTWRGFNEHGNTIKIQQNQHYMLETYIHETLLISPHRCGCVGGRGAGWPGLACPTHLPFVVAWRGRVVVACSVDPRS